MRPGCQGGERIHHVSGSFAGAPLGSLPALLQEEGHYLTIRESGGMSLPAAEAAAEGLGEASEPWEDSLLQNIAPHSGPEPL